MKNISKVFLLIFTGVSITLAFYLFRVSGVYSQTKKVSNSSALSNGNVVSNSSEHPAEIDQANIAQTSGRTIEKKSEREGICSSGFDEIPVELQQTYIEQNKQIKNDGDSFKLVYPLLNEVSFYGFTYPFNNVPEMQRDETQCTNKPLEPEKIKFVMPQVNEAVKKYISTMIYNETQISIVKNKLSENHYFMNKVFLCLDIECGTKNPKAEKQSFDALTVGNLIYAKSYSDTQIFVNALNNIRSISQSDESQYLTDSEIIQILSIAGRMALTKVRMTGN